MSLNNRKAVIIGAGHVGSHVGYALSSQGLVDEIVYIDTNRVKAIAQALDIFDATAYLPHHVNVKAGTYQELDDADLLIVAAGPLPDMEKGQTRMDTLAQTVEVLKDIVEGIQSSHFDGVIISISNPADVVAHYLQTKLNYPANKVISTSTTLDSARLKRALCEALAIDQKSIYAYVLGEHGESQMVAWSTVSIAGLPILDYLHHHPEKKVDLDQIAKEARLGGWHILGGKGSTEFGIGATLAEVARAILSNENRVLPVSVLLNGEYGQSDVYASVPAVLGRDGVVEIISLPLSRKEQQQFDASCKTMKEQYKLALSW